MHKTAYLHPHTRLYDPHDPLCGHHKNYLVNNCCWLMELIHELRLTWHVGSGSGLRLLMVSSSHASPSAQQVFLQNDVASLWPNGM